MIKRQVAQHKPGTAMTIGGPVPWAQRDKAQGGLAGLLAGVSISAAALALAAIPQQARAQAQAVNGTPTVLFGADAPTRTTTADSFNVTANDALIDWAVTDSTVFLNSGTTLSFSRDGGAYTVLNRVASSPLSGTLAINGRVQSDPQGKIWFYNPGGWVVGSGATIDVGSLVLTANPIQVTDTAPDGQKFLGANGEIRFGQANVGSSVTVASGAFITASQNDSYVALVAPRVVQAGSVTSNGSTAYVAAGAVDITINNGLFDIVVSNGTDDPNGVVHSGSTSGTVNNSSSATPQGIYLVAVPKNDALTMLVSGNLGYNSASSASTTGGKIVLSAGYGVAAGEIDPASRVGGANIAVSIARLTSNTEGKASNAIDVIADSGSGFVGADLDLALAADTRIGVLAQGGESFVTVGGNLALRAGRGATGGIVDVSVDGGAQLLVGGDFEANADGIGAIQTDPGNGDALLGGAAGEAATGGSVKIAVGNAGFSVNGETRLSANATGGLGGASAGSATAGTVSLTVDPAASFQIDASGGISATADANASPPSLGAGPESGAAANGGMVNLVFGSGFSGSLLNVSAFANALSGSDAAAKAATSGNVSIAFTGGTSDLSTLQASIGASAVNGGTATGGDLAVSVSGADLTVGDTFSLDSFLFGATANPGVVSLTVNGGGILTFIPRFFFSQLSLFSEADGTDGTAATAPALSLTLDNGQIQTTRLGLESDAFSGSAGNATGGDITLAIRGNSVLGVANDLSLQSTGFGGSGIDAGDGLGGAILATIGTGTVNADSLALVSTGLAGRRFSQSGRIGTGVGGSADLVLNDPAASLTVNSALISAPGAADFGRESIVALDLAPPSSGPGAGANGTGGTASVTVTDGTLAAASSMILAQGSGGRAFNTSANVTVGAVGGTGNGGSASLAITGGSVEIGFLTVDTAGRGGSGASADSETGAPAGAGGIGQGGSSNIDLTGGTLTGTQISVSAAGNQPNFFFSDGVDFSTYYGTGGAPFGNGSVGGTGGVGQGGTATFTVDGGALADRNDPDFGPLSVSVDASGFGGYGGAAGFFSGGGEQAGDGGTGKGGTAGFAFLSGAMDAQSVFVGSSGIGGIAGYQTSCCFGFRSPSPTVPSLGGDGGDGYGGDATIIIGTSLDPLTPTESTRSVSIDASGLGGNAAGGDIAGNGGGGFGGNATLSIVGGAVTLNSVSLFAGGEGANGSDAGRGNRGGNGGDAQGGTAQALVDGAGASLVLTNGTLDASAAGGNGGSGGSGADGLDAAGNGGNGGVAVGGTARFSASGGGVLDFSQRSEFDFTADATGGNGGQGGNAQFNGGNAIGDGGNGGDAGGGTLEFSANNGQLLLGAASFGASGSGGSGGGRLAFDGSSTDASNGGDGGSGVGGSFNLTATGSAGSIQANSLDVNVDGFGGSGTDGQGYDPVTFVGASGGAGVAGTGGTIRLDAFDQGTITVNGGSTLTANGHSAFGGVGAQGGTNPVTGDGGAGGTGGNSGQGNGGTVNLNAEGGLIETGDLGAVVNGYGSDGSQGGAGGSGIVPPSSPVGTLPAPDGAFGASGIGGGGLGGLVQITALTGLGGTQGGLNFGAVNLDLRSYISDGDFNRLDVAGGATIDERVDESRGGVRFASLNVDARGVNGFDNSSLYISSRNAPIRVAGNLTASTAGYVNVDAFDTGGLDVGGTLNLTTDSTIGLISFGGGLIRANDVFLSAASQISVTAVDCAGPLCPVVHADNTLDAFAGDDFALIGPAQVSASGELRVRSENDVIGDAGSGFAGPSMLVTAAGGVTIRNASGGTLNAEAGLISFGEGSFFVNGNLTLGEAAGSGVFDLGGSLFGSAGTSIDVTAGTSIDTGNTIELISGDDVRIGAGATLTNTTSGSEPGFIRLDAGGLVTDGSYPAGNVASLLIGSGATIDGTGGSVTLSGGAIDGRGATLRGADFTADVVNPPAAGVAQRDDNGQLTTPCLEGDICLGAIAATGAVRIGQGDFAPVTFTGTGNISGASVAITSRDTLTYGAAASPFTITSVGPILLTSQAGDIALAGNALIDGGSVALSATGSVTGNGRLRSAGDIGIDVGSSITLDSLMAGRQLTTVAGIGGALEPLYTLPGNLTVTSLQTAALTAIRAGGSIVIGNATTGGNDLSLTAGTLVSLGTDSNVAILSLTGLDVAFATVTANGNIVLTATNAIAGTSAIAGGTLQASGATLDANTLRSGAAMTLTTSGATTLGTATAGTTLAFDGASLSATTLTSGGDMTLASSGAAQIGDANAGGSLTATTGDLAFASLTSANATQINAASVSGGDIAAGTSLAVASPGAISLGAANGGDTLDLNGATIDAAMLTSGDTMTLTSSGATTLGTANSGGDLSIASQALAFDSLTSTGATAIDAASIAGGDIAAGTSLSAQATGALLLGAATAGTTLAFDGASISATTLTSGGDMTLASSGAAQIGDANAGGSLTATTGDLAFTSLTSGNATQINAASVSGGDIAAGTSLAVASPGAISLGAANGGDTLDLNGATIDGAMLTSGAAITLTSIGATTLGTATSGGSLSIDSGALAFVGLTSTGATTIDAASIAGGDIAAGTSLVIASPGAISLGVGNAGTALALGGTSLAATALRSGGAMTMASSGAASLGSATSGADLTIATGDLTFASLTSIGATRIDASAVNGGNIAAGTTLAVATPGAIKLGTASAGTTFTANAASLQFAGITAAGDAALTAATVTGGDVTSTAGAIRLAATGAATLGQLRAGTDVTAQATTLTFAGITAGRDITLDVTTLGGTAISAGQDLTIRSVNDLTFGTIAAGRNLSLSASTGAITVNTDIDAGGTVSLAGDAILIKAVGPLTVATVTADNGDIAIVTDGLLRVSNAAARGDVTLTSTANSLILGPVVAGRALATPSALNSSETSSGTPGPGAITLSAAQAITLQGTVDALTALAATAGTLIDQRSLAVGKTIAYRSADLTLGQTAALGQSNFTTAIALTNTGGAGALLGDVGGTAAGYRLDNAEFGRIHSGGDLSLAGGSSLTVGMLAASAASGSGGVADGNIGATSTLSLSTSGELSVGGALALGNAAGNTLRLTSGTVSVDAGAGSARLVEGSGHGGTLAISTGDLLALTSAARSAIVGMDGNAINLRLAQNDGVSDGRTLLEAGSIAISASGRVLIQNTAVGQTFDARRGFVADSLAISTGGSTGTTESSGNSLIVINGTVAGQTGLTALRAVQVSGGFDELSTVNGCRLLTATCGSPQFDPLRELIEDEIGRGSNLDSGDAVGEGVLIQIDRFEPLGFEAVIDEPVTGSGNDDFLVPEAGTGDQQCEADDKTKCDKPPEG